MSVRLRLALQFGAILAVTLLLFALVIYVATQQSRRALFTQSLFKRTLVVGHAYAAGQEEAADAGHRAAYGATGGSSTARCPPKKAGCTTTPAAWCSAALTQS